MANKKLYDAKDYELMKAIKKIAEDWINAVNKDIVTQGEGILSHNTDGNIHIRYDKATDKFSPEDDAKIKAFKASLTPINLGEKTAKVIINNISPKNMRRALDYINKARETKSTQALKAKVASKTKR